MSATLASRVGSIGVAAMTKHNHVSLVAPDTGVLCCIVFTLKADTTMKGGSEPHATPIKDDPVVIILSAANDPEPGAAIVIAGAACV